MRRRCDWFDGLQFTLGGIMESLNELVRIANQHGVAASINSEGSVDVRVGWYKPSTREHGYEIYKVRNLRQLRDALGY